MMTQQETVASPRPKRTMGRVSVPKLKEGLLNKSVALGRGTNQKPESRGVVTYSAQVSCQRFRAGRTESESGRTCGKYPHTDFQQNPPFPIHLPLKLPTSQLQTHKRASTQILEIPNSFQVTDTKKVYKSICTNLHTMCFFPYIQRIFY